MTLITILGLILILIGIWGMLTQRNIIKIIIGFSIVDTGVHLIMVSIGYLKDRTAPIIDSAVSQAEAVNKVVDPVPSALVLTAIVIGLAVTALMLSYAIKLYEKKGTLDINEFKELKW
ncbi:MAG: NADH-quinone oxidoreductase subunit K [Candidatus Marinimicrobia bacterium]|nr:NADH-quinone oxidoreductase subunit K [Candidatus Neomarinimicrobiota bacterium]